MRQCCFLNRYAPDKEQLQQKLKCSPPGATMPFQPLAHLPFTRVLNSATYKLRSFDENLSNSTYGRKARCIRYGKLATLWPRWHCIVVRGAWKQRLSFYRGRGEALFPSGEGTSHWIQPRICHFVKRGDTFPILLENSNTSLHHVLRDFNCLFFKHVSFMLTFFSSWFSYTT